MSTRVELRLPSRMEYLGVPDVVLLEIGGELGCGKRRLEELGTAIIEACTNAMEHGNHLAEELFIEIWFELDDDNITVTVLDQGPGFDHAGWIPSEDLMRQRGRGILIMREFTDHLEFSRHADGRFLTRLVKKIGPDDGQE
ncbi:MAG: ATP-binding protein [bacterium]|jgi:serine/threonine-protein kinase RsbW|nr:ATP-binding protein [bacterium]